MGFPCICHAIILPRSLAISLCILQRVWYTIAVVLYYLGIPIAHEALPGLLSVEATYPAANPSTPASTITPTVIKGNLREVEFASLLARRKPTCSLEEPPTCMVCLGWLEAKDEVRELGNCSHAFHMACIDRWVDMGHVTCPLCRLELLPSHKEERVWMKRSLRTSPRLW